MFERILIPTDFSTASEWAFDEAVHLAAAHRSELVVLHVRMTRASHPQELRFPFDASLYDYAEQQELARLRGRIRDAGLEVSTRLLVRHAPAPAAEISRTALVEGASLVVMATNASHHVAHLIIGSTTNSLLQQPPAPLLVIRYGTRKRTGLGRVVVAVADSGQPGPSLRLASAVAASIEVVVFSEAAVEGARTAASAAKAGTTVRLLAGPDLEKETIRHAAAIDADAIFLDASAAPDAAMLDIIRHAPMPVMVVPESR